MRFILATLMLAYPSIIQAAERTWTSEDGASFRGEFVSSNFDKVSIRRAEDEKVFEVPMLRLSLKDQYYAFEKMGKNLLVIDTRNKLANHKGHLRGYWVEDDDVVTIHIDEWTITGKSDPKEPVLGQVYFHLAEKKNNGWYTNSLSEKLELNHKFTNQQPLVLRDLTFKLDVDGYDKDDVWFVCCYESMGADGHRRLNFGFMDIYPFSGKRRK